MVPEILFTNYTQTSKLLMNYTQFIYCYDILQLIIYFSYERGEGNLFEKFYIPFANVHNVPFNMVYIQTTLDTHWYMQSE